MPSQDFSCKLSKSGKEAKKMFENKEVKGNRWAASEIVLQNETVVVITVQDSDGFQHIIMVPDCEIDKEYLGVTRFDLLYLNDYGSFGYFVLVRGYNYSISQIISILDSQDVEYRELTNRYLFKGE